MKIHFLKREGKNIVIARDANPATATPEFKELQEHRYKLNHLYQQLLFKKQQKF